MSRDHLTSRAASAACIMAMLVVVFGGCATPAASPIARAPLSVVVLRSDVRITVGGDLLNRAQSHGPERQGLLSRLLFGPAPSPPHRLRTPQGMGLAGDTLLVCDQGVPDVLAVDLETRSVRSCTRIESRPACPVDACDDGLGSIIVADTATRTVRAYGPDGRQLWRIAPPGGAAAAFRPTSVVVRDGVLYVGDAGNACVQRYALSRANWMDPWPTEQGSTHWGAPTGLAFTTSGVLLVADALQSVVHRVGADGTPLAPIGRPGRRVGEFVRPKDVAVTEDGLIVVTDAARQSLLVFDAQGDCVAELAGQSDWAGWTLPFGVTALSADAAARLTAGHPRANARDDDGSGHPQGALVVSDALGAPSLTVLWIEATTGLGDRDAGAH